MIRLHSKYQLEENEIVITIHQFLSNGMNDEETYYMSSRITSKSKSIKYLKALLFAVTTRNTQMYLVKIVSYNIY